MVKKNPLNYCVLIFNFVICTASENRMFYMNGPETSLFMILYIILPAKIISEMNIKSPCAGTMQFRARIFVFDNLKRISLSLFIIFLLVVVENNINFLLHEKRSKRH